MIPTKSWYLWYLHKFHWFSNISPSSAEQPKVWERGRRKPQTSRPSWRSLRARGLGWSLGSGLRHPMRPPNGDPHRKILRMDDLPTQHAWVWWLEGSKVGDVYNTFFFSLMVSRRCQPPPLALNLEVCGQKLVDTSWCLFMFLPLEALVFPTKKKAGPWRYSLGPIFGNLACRSTSSCTRSPASGTPRSQEIVDSITERRTINQQSWQSWVIWQWLCR